VAIVRRGFHEPGEVGARGSKFAQEVFRRHADLRRQRTIRVDAAADGRSCRVGVSDGRSLSWGRAAVNPHLVLTGNRPMPGTALSSSAAGERHASLPRGSDMNRSRPVRDLRGFRAMLDGARITNSRRREGMEACPV